MSPPSQKLASGSIPGSYWGRRNFCRRGTLFSAGRIVPSLWSDCRWPVGRCLGQYLQDCLLSGITCIVDQIFWALPVFPSSSLSPSVIVENISSSTSLNLFKQLNMLLADWVSNCGCVFHSQADHSCVCCLLDWDGAVPEIPPEET